VAQEFAPKGAGTYRLDHRASTRIFLLSDAHADRIHFISLSFPRKHTTGQLGYFKTTLSLQLNCSVQIRPFTIIKPAWFL